MMLSYVCCSLHPPGLRLFLSKFEFTIAVVKSRVGSGHTNRLKVNEFEHEARVILLTEAKRMANGAILRL
jgi:hypothetical protein